MDGLLFYHVRTFVYVQGCW